MVALSHKWLRQVLQDRGVHAPPESACAAFVASLDETARASARAALDSIARGVETSQTLDELLGAIDAAGRRADESTSPAKQLCVSEVTTVASSNCPGNRAAPTDSSQDRPWVRDHGVHIYGQKAAMKIELDLLRGDPGMPARYTVQLELAPAKAARTFDWQRKVGFQFTRRELPLLGAMLLGYAGDALVLTNHGPEHDKRLELQMQGPSLYVKLRQGARALALPVGPADTFAWSAITLNALKKNDEALDCGLLLEMLKRTGAMSIAAASQHQQPSK